MQYTQIKKIFLITFFSFFVISGSTHAQVVQPIVPILTYHRIENISKDTPALRRHFIVTPKMFEKQIKYLYTQKYQTLTLDQFHELVANKKEIPKNAIIITFDDGYQSHYQYGYKILKKYNFQGVFFVYTKAIGHFSENMTWEELLEMYINGMQIGNHTVSHRKLPGIINQDLMRIEIADSKKMIEYRVTGGYRVGAFAYPYGLSTPYIENVVRETGHTIAVSDDEGVNGLDIDYFHLRRHTVLNDMKNFTNFLQTVEKLNTK